jgi:hypothetical protein
VTAFVSQRPNTDPEPYLYPDGHRNSVGGAWAGQWPKLAPRPEYTQTRDKEPWVTNQGVRSEFPIHGRSKWDPRHDEFDPPVNPIIAAYRSEPDFDLWDIGFAMFTTYGGEKSWEQPGHYFHCFVVASPTEIDLARRVLSKLGAVYS